MSECHGVLFFVQGIEIKWFSSFRVLFYSGFVPLGVNCTRRHPASAEELGEVWIAARHNKG